LPFSCFLIAGRWLLVADNVLICMRRRVLFLFRRPGLQSRRKAAPKQKTPQILIRPSAGGLVLSIHDALYRAIYQLSIDIMGYYAEPREWRLATHETNMPKPVIPTGAARFFLPRRFVARRAAQRRDLLLSRPFLVTSHCFPPPGTKDTHPRNAQWCGTHSRCKPQPVCHAPAGLKRRE